MEPGLQPDRIYILKLPTVSQIISLTHHDEYQAAVQVKEVKHKNKERSKETK